MTDKTAVPTDRSTATAKATVVDLAALRAPFPPALVGRLPKVVCRSCAVAPARVCGRHTKSRCDQCRAWITVSHVHLDFVGHGAVTHRLLEVDPDWNWVPVAWGPDGLPAMTRDSNGQPVVLWIYLTVGGVTRLGVGTCTPGRTDPEKVLIGDALRNAAMRFGVALDLWVRGHTDDDDEPIAGTAGTDGTAEGPASADDDFASYHALRLATTEISDPVARDKIVAWVKDQKISKFTMSRAQADTWAALLPEHPG